MPGISDDAKRKREDWTQANAAYTDARASSNWAADEMTWGVFGVPESSLDSLGAVGGLHRGQRRFGNAAAAARRAVVAGCAPRYARAGFARRAARPVGVDVTPAQLEPARRCQAEF